MTTLTLASPHADRSVRWPLLAWVAWRRYRTTLIATSGTLGVIALYLFINGHQIYADYNAWRSCTPHSSAACDFQLSNFRNKYGSTGIFGFIQVLAPGLIGAFAGAPLVARELETRTYQYAWTQGVGRTRWTLAVLTPPLIGTAAIAAAFGELVAWRNQPLVDTGIGTRMDGSLFPAVPPAAIGWSLAGFAIGVLTGLLWRRVLPALATTVVAWFGLATLASLGLRKHYLTPLVTDQLQVNSTSLTVSTWWTKGSHTVGTSQLNQVLQTAGLPGFNDNTGVKAAPGNAPIDPVHYLIQQGYTQWTSYQPSSRYWPFEWIELGWLTFLAAVLLSVAILFIRKRQS